MSIRLIDAGTVSALRSQSVYHAVAHAKTEGTPDTVILVTSAEPYMCIGYHQELEREIDTEFCKANGLPVIRREVGGGAVYLDRNQLFVQWIFQRDRLPWRLTRRFEFFSKPMVNTYRALEIQAYFRPPNDVQVSGRKIAGLGAGAVGNAEVLVGNFLFDFDAGIMSKALRVSNEKFRDKIRESMQEYITTTKKELGRIPDIETVKQTYIRRCKDTLGERLEIGTFTDSELRTLEKTEARLDSVSWLSQEGALIRSGIKIHSDVWLYQTNYSTPGAQVYATLRVKEDRIDDVSLSGDFQFHPESKLREFENFLLNRKLSNAGLLAAIESFYQAEGIHSPGLQAQDWVRALLMHKAPEYRV